MAYQVGPSAREEIVGIIERTDTAVHNIAKGEYVVWKGVLKQANTSIASGTALSATNLDDVPNGLGGEVKSLSDHLAQLSIKFPRYTSAQTMQTLPWTAPYDCMLILCLEIGTSSGTWAHIHINDKYAFGAPTGSSATTLFLKQGDIVKKGNGAGSFTVAASAYYHLGDET